MFIIVRLLGFFSGNLQIGLLFIFFNLQDLVLHHQKIDFPYRRTAFAK